MNEIELTAELVRINSENPPGNERAVASFIHDYLQDLGFETEKVEYEPNRFNVVAQIGRGDGMILAGHTDTVPIGTPSNWKHGPLSGEVRGNRVYGRGSADMKGGIGSILAPLSSFDFGRMKRRLVLLFVADEETNSTGAKWIINNRKQLLSGVKYGVMAEPTYNTIRIGQKGKMMTKIKFRGKSAHGSRPWLGDSAISKAGKFVKELERLSSLLKKRKDPLLGHGTINVGMIRGGTKVNMVPDYCELEIDRRLIPGETPQKALKQYKDISKKLNLNAEIELSGEARLPMKIPKSSTLVREIKSLVDNQIAGGAGYTESELFYKECGIEFVSFGPGNPEDSHKDDEFVEISKLREARYVFENLVKKWCMA